MWSSLIPRLFVFNEWPGNEAMCERASLVPRPSTTLTVIEGLGTRLWKRRSLLLHTRKKKRSWIRGWSSSCVKKPTSAKGFQMSIKCLLLWFLKWFSIEHGKHSQEAIFLVRFCEFNSGHTSGSHASCDPWTNDVSWCNWSYFKNNGYLPSTYIRT